MKYTALLAGEAGLALIAACGGGATAPAEAQDTEAAAPAAAPAEIVLDASLAEVNGGAYSLERTHAFLTWKVGHQRGISDYTVQFGDFDADLSFDPSDPAASTLSVTINPLNLIVNYPGDYKAGHADSPYETWAEDMARNERWLNADNFPDITFTSTDVSVTGSNTGTVTGDLTFLGVTQPVTLDVTYNGVGGAPWFGDRDLIGFNAKTTINRSDFGNTTSIPGITDAVEIEFSGEFLQDE
ncbi:MAG: YceI family protein [Pseudomonadota bacterium]